MPAPENQSDKPSPEVTAQQAAAKPVKIPKKGDVLTQKVVDPDTGEVTTIKARVIKDRVSRPKK